jgi:hypothetical protein
MMGGLTGLIAKIFSSKEELSYRNIRGVMWAAILVFPLSVITGDLRYFDLKMSFWGLQSYELMLFPLGLGWYIFSFLPQKFIIPSLRISAVLCAVLLPFQFLFTDGIARLAVFMGFQFFNGVCAGAAFYLFCFTLNNVERLFGMMIIQFYYGFYYTIWRSFPSVSGFRKIMGRRYRNGALPCNSFLLLQKKRAGYRNHK